MGRHIEILEGIKSKRMGNKVRGEVGGINERHKFKVGDSVEVDNGYGEFIPGVVVKLLNSTINRIPEYEVEFKSKTLGKSVSKTNEYRMRKGSK